MKSEPRRLACRRCDAFGAHEQVGGVEYVQRDVEPQHVRVRERGERDLPRSSVDGTRRIKAAAKQLSRWSAATDGASTSWRAAGRGRAYRKREHKRARDGHQHQQALEAFAHERLGVDEEPIRRERFVRFVVHGERKLRCRRVRRFKPSRDTGRAVALRLYAPSVLEGLRPCHAAQPPIPPVQVRPSRSRLNRTSLQVHSQTCTCTGTAALVVHRTPHARANTGAHNLARRRAHGKQRPRGCFRSAVAPKRRTARRTHICPGLRHICPGLRHICAGLRAGRTQPELLRRDGDRMGT